ncbi:uncharacterized protein LOC124655272 [Lolium rigidum]|uniref:uncharacterized protein LOC124655272 n=1 Tax=Lolium rigidum TaxID=89674 RepID=UPI001F5E052E|nr:uncharacterized protein LOC124655272 [Lolium rigidum]
MAAIATRLHHSPPALRRGGPPSNPFLRFASSPRIVIRSRAAATPPLGPVSARGDEDEDEALPYPEPRRSPLSLSPLLVAAAAVAATPQAALALSGGSCGGSDSSSSSSSSSDDSSTDSIDWSSSSWSSNQKKKKKEGLEATHESVGTAVAPPKPPSDMWVWGGFALAFAMIVVAATNGSDERTSVVKLQVALRGREMVKPVQKDLNAIAERVQASNRQWYKFILTETLDTLRRHQSFCISSCLSVLDTFIHALLLLVVKTLLMSYMHGSRVVRKNGWEDEDDSWKAHFDRVSAQERRKFDEETLWNWNGVKQKKTYSMKTDGSKNEYVVVTILVAAEGTMELPEAIRSAADLDAVAARLNSTPESELRGVRVLWTPQDADDVLSEERMRKDYPNLKPLAR